MVLGVSTTIPPRAANNLTMKHVADSNTIHKEQKLNIFVDAISKSSVIRFHRKLKDNTNELLFTTDLSSLSNKSFSIFIYKLASPSF